MTRRARRARRLPVDEVQEDGDVVRAEAPERVLVRSCLAEVEAVAVDVVDLAELTRVGELLELADAGVVLEQVSNHQRAIGAFGGRDHALCVGDRERERLLDEAVLASGEHALGELGVRGHGGRESDRVERVVLEQILETVGHRDSRQERRGAIARVR